VELICVEHIHYRLHSSPVTCLTITDDLIVGGSTFGTIAIADQTSGQKLGVLKSVFAPLGKHLVDYKSYSWPTLTCRLRTRV
jgi:hypothetical protein